MKLLGKDLKLYEDLRNKIIPYKDNITITIKKAKGCRNIVKETIKYLTKVLR